jgi:hypothetical protein
VNHNTAGIDGGGIVTDSTTVTRNNSLIAGNTPNDIVP